MTHRLKQIMRQSLLHCSMFENMGFNYLGPVNGHDLAQLTQTLKYAREINEPVLLHVKTVKGKGYLPAEENPDEFHGVAPFDPLTGQPQKMPGESFSSVFGAALARLGKQDSRVCAITAAMTGGTGLEHFQKACPERFFDVGIAEGCARLHGGGHGKAGDHPCICRLFHLFAAVL